MYRVTVHGGIRCAVEDVNPGGERAILFVHGWPLSHDIFDSQFTVLPEYGIRCIGMDLRGYGDSDKPWNGYDYDSFAADLHQVIRQTNCRCLTLCGFSMGAAVCVRYLSLYGDTSIDKLALCAPACPSFVQQIGYPYGMTRGELDQLIAQGYDERPQLCAEFSRRCFSENPGEATLQWVTNICLQAPGRSLLQGAEVLADADLRGDLGNIRIPTMILHGKQDQICPFSFAEETHRGISGSFVIPFEHSGHFLFYEEKNKFNNCLLDFVNTR